MLGLLIIENEKESVKQVFASKPTKSKLNCFLEYEFTDKINTTTRGAFSKS